MLLSLDFAYLIENYFMSFKKVFFFFLERGGGREKERERNICVCERNINRLPPARPQLGICPATQARALTENQTDNPLVCRRMPSPVSHTNQGFIL